MIQLKDICDIYDCPHTTAKDDGKGYPLVRTPNVGKGRLILNGIHRVSEDVYNSRNARAIPEEGDLILAREAPVGNVSIIMDGQRVCLGQRVVLIKPKRELVDPHFLTYYLLSAEVQHRLKNHANGAVVAHLNVSDIRNLLITLPELDEQIAIGKILRSIDDKIELNRQINDNLEQQAQALYKSWFVDNQHPDCEEINLSEIIYFQEGPGIRNWQYVEKDGVRFINIRCIDGGDINLTSANMISKEEANGKYAHFLLKPFDIIMSCSGTLGRYAIVRKEHLPLCLNTSVIRFSPNRSDSDYSYIYGYLASEEFLNKQVEMACGSVQANFGPTHLKQIKIIAPPIDYCKKYNTIAMPIINKILENRREIQELHTLRNTLLPKLMSGELNINEIDR